MTLADWLARIELRHPLGIDGIELGLERVEAVRQRLCTATGATGISGGRDERQRFDLCHA